ncbi:MAG: hypothetical protein WCH77_03590 [Planctomycetota bacterium]
MIPRRWLEIACLLWAAAWVLPIGAADPLPLAPEALAPEAALSLPITVPRRVPRMIALTGVDTPGDPGSTPPSAAASPAESSGPFDIPRGDVGEDEDILTPSGRRRTAAQRELDALPIGSIPDPLRGTPLIAPEVTGRDAAEVLAKMLPGRSDSPYDWYAPVEPLHVGCEPYALPPCVPPPPCHPSEPPQPYDLVGVRGVPSGGPIYRGPCNPRTGTHDHCHFAWYHRLHDRCFDCFYRWK